MFTDRGSSRPGCGRKRRPGRPSTAPTCVRPGRSSPPPAATGPNTGSRSRRSPRPAGAGRSSTHGSPRARTTSRSSTTAARPSASIPTITREVLAAVIRAAHVAGKSWQSSTSSARERARDAIAEGADGLVHLFTDRPADEAFIRLGGREAGLRDPDAHGPGERQRRRQRRRRSRMTRPWPPGSARPMSGLLQRFFLRRTTAEVRAIPLETVRKLKAAGVPILGRHRRDQSGHGPWREHPPRAGAARRRGPLAGRGPGRGDLRTRARSSAWPTAGGSPRARGPTCSSSTAIRRRHQGDPQDRRRLEAGPSDRPRRLPQGPAEATRRRGPGEGDAGAQGLGERAGQRFRRR